MTHYPETVTMISILKVFNKFLFSRYLILTSHIDLCILSNLEILIQ